MLDHLWLKHAHTYACTHIYTYITTPKPDAGITNLPHVEFFAIDKALVPLDKRLVVAFHVGGRDNESEEGIVRRVRCTG